MRRVCLLTGASGPLGTAFVERYVGRYEIAAVHHRTTIYFPTQDQSYVDPFDPQTPPPANGRSVHAIRADIRDEDQIEAAISETLEKFGRVDVLVNAAAVRRFSPLLASGADGHADEMFVVNVLAPLRFALALGRGFWRADPAGNVSVNRNVVNVSSTAGLFVYPDTGQALYAASKAALNHLTYHLASEMWDLGIRVNAIAPDTFPGRVSTEEVLDAIVDLDESDVTGEVRPLHRSG